MEAPEFILPARKNPRDQRSRKEGLLRKIRFSRVPSGREQRSRDQILQSLWPTKRVPSSRAVPEFPKANERCCQRRFLRRYSERPEAVSLASSRNRPGSGVVKLKQDLPCMRFWSCGEIFFCRDVSQYSGMK